MAASLDMLLTAMQNGVTAINNLNTTIKATFPRTTASSSTVTTGTITFQSSTAVGFMIVQTSSGATVKIPFYGQ